MRKKPCNTAGLCGLTSPTGSSHPPTKTTTSQDRHLEKAALEFLIAADRPTPEMVLDALDDSKPKVTRQIAEECGLSDDSTRHTLLNLIRRGRVRRVRFRENRPGSRWEIGYLRLPPESIGRRGVIIR